MADLEITAVEVIPIRIPNRIPIKLATVRLEHQDNVIVRLRAGPLAGVGETQPLAGFRGCVESHATIVPAIRDRIAPAVLRRDASAPEAVVGEIERSIPGSPYAKAAVVDALYDLLARAWKVPLCQLLGGPVRDQIPVVWTIGIGDGAAMAEEARRAVGRGFRLLKLKVGARRADEDVRAMEAVRTAVGPGIGIRIDANGALGFDEGLALLRRLAGFGLELAEQPLPIDDLDGMARLITLTGVPVMPDESLTSPASALELVAKRAASVFGMKLAKHGGIHPARAIAAIAAAAAIPVYPGGQPGTSVGAATAAHFYAATPNATLGGDFHVGPAGWLADDVVRNPLVVADGHALVPHGVGIATELDEGKLARYAVAV
jgi:L-alanine-DL-glutamate epimerase-like enolase superfamily enzyme